MGFGGLEGNAAVGVARNAVTLRLYLTRYEENYILLNIYATTGIHNKKADRPRRGPRGRDAARP